MNGSLQFMKCFPMRNHSRVFQLFCKVGREVSDFTLFIAENEITKLVFWAHWSISSLSKENKIPLESQLQTSYVLEDKAKKKE